MNIRDVGSPKIASSGRLWLFLLVALAVVLAACSAEKVESAPFIEGEDPVSRATAFLISNESILGPEAIYPLEYLRRRYGATWANQAVERLANESRLPENRERLYPFLRLLDPDATYVFDPSKPSSVFDQAPTAWNLVMALHCRDVPLTSEFLRLLEEQALSWDRGAAIGARALGWAREQECLSASDTAGTDQLLREKMLANLRNARNPDGSVRSNIVVVESVSMLLYLGHRDDIDHAWIKTIENWQSPDGSWDLSGDTARDVATSETLLALTQYHNPEAPRIPWVPPRASKALPL